MDEKLFLVKKKVTNQITRGGSGGGGFARPGALAWKTYLFRYVVLVLETTKRWHQLSKQVFSLYTLTDAAICHNQHIYIVMSKLKFIYFVNKEAKTTHLTKMSFLFYFQLGHWRVESRSSTSTWPPWGTSDGRRRGRKTRLQQSNY